VWRPRVSECDRFSPSQSFRETRKHRQQQIEVPLRDANQVVLGRRGIALWLGQRQAIRTQREGIWGIAGIGFGCYVLIA
jgi:hypothetical protein